MTKIFIACLVLFPLMFIGMLVATGTLTDLTPILKSQLEDTLRGRLMAPDTLGPASLGIVDSLVVAGIERRESDIAASLDSLEVMRSRLATERQQLERLSQSVERVIGELKELEQTIATQRDKERKSLARMFGEMDPERAAEILGLLAEEDVEFLVKSMKQRQAAEILAMLSPGVAARVSGRILNKPEDERREIRP